VLDGGVVASDEASALVVDASFFIASTLGIPTANFAQLSNNQPPGSVRGFAKYAVCHRTVK
jgi:hypothetical protein